MKRLTALIAAAKDNKLRTQSELDATSLRNRIIKDDLAHLVSLHELECAVQRQLEDAARAKRKARAALPRVHAALRTAFTCPEGWEQDEHYWRSFAETVWRRS
jgi:hypothetical protein